MTFAIFQSMKALKMAVLWHGNHGTRCLKLAAEFAPKISGADMQVIDYEPLPWLLLQYDGVLFLDIPPNQSIDAA